MECSSAQASVSRKNLDIKKKRLGKGSNILTTVSKLLAESEIWLKVEGKNNYHFPGVLPKSMFQQLYSTENALSLQQSCEDAHFIWKDIQLSKGQLQIDQC